MLRKTLGWVDETGEPIQEQHEFSYRELEGAAGVSHSRLGEAIEDALKGHFIRCIQKARVQTQGVRSQSAAYELCWDDDQYTDEPENFQGFYLQPSYCDREGQTRLGRKNIPNVFFDYLIRAESRRVIRAVGTLLWYSIDWGKGGERRITVRKSLRDLVELTHLEQSNVVRALNEAEEKGYVERIERGVFDLSGKKQSSTTVYGIRWTTEYTYTYEGLAVEVEERSQKATQQDLANAPKKPHEVPRVTLPKSHTEDDLERSQKATRNAPKKPHVERSQKATIRITKTNIPNTSIPNNSTSSPAPISVAAVSPVIERLVQEGFSWKVAVAILKSSSEEVILQQLELLPHRTASKNRLGLLRKAIEENWPAPEFKTKDVFSSPGKLFVSHFYAGYHGNPDAPVTDPSPAETQAGESFIARLLELVPDPSLAPKWGRQFGEAVQHRHTEKKQLLPSLPLALRQFGDAFYTGLKAGIQAERQARLQDAWTQHVSKFKSAHQAYLSATFEQHASEQSGLFQELLADEEHQLKSIRSNKFGLDIDGIVRRYQSAEERLKRFESLLGYAQAKHDVLDFWSWDRKLNPEPFDEGKI